MARMCLLSALVISACMILVKGELIGDTAKKRYNTNPGTGNGKAYVATKHPLKEGQLQKFEVYIHKATTRTVSARLFIWSRVGTSNEFVLDYSIPAELPKEEGLFPVIVPDPKPWVKEGSFMGWAYQSPGDVISFDYNTQFNTEFSFTLQAGDPFPWPILEETYTFDATPLRFEHAIAVDITVGTKPTTTITTTTTAQTTTTTTAAAPVASDTDTRKGLILDLPRMG
ncbi:uncharacterized protein LOC106154972 [Lingula anatina]|uniref:Uncharacterized protein LOC106154972 n=1 Tax=Lingula anatina TaxID=7574 RepID=A0A1S3HJ28_LINAN|nr:uncharacterized protein LOC106154972 [Lingula anatina]|eukprot:XP_013384999.1 uncharacterized protein LOC106154972 [Lingula anatina]